MKMPILVLRDMEDGLAVKGSDAMNAIHAAIEEAGSSTEAEISADVLVQAINQLNNSVATSTATLTAILGVLATVELLDHEKAKILQALVDIVASYLTMQPEALTDDHHQHAQTIIAMLTKWVKAKQQKDEAPPMDPEAMKALCASG